MAAPTPSPRQTPAGTRPNDGHKTHVVLSANPTASIWETEVTPLGGTVNTFDLLHMHLNTYGQKGLGSLRRGKEITVTALYDPVIYSTLWAQLGSNQVITVHFPNHSSVCFHGALTDISPGANKEGEAQMGTFTFTPTFSDPSDGSETAPVYTAGGGTGA
jgi:hypothetical protein